jgi:hemolysin activation/secretion protein
MRFGGINSIRGFEENSLTANLFSVINTEFRYKVNNSLYVHSVIDGAYFENDLVDTKGKLFGFGFGFGLLTKSGLFKFNYSNGKTENQTFKLSDSKIHLSLTASF